jgi:hypothetical protein
MMMWCGLDYVRARVTLIFCEGLPEIGMTLFVFKNPFCSSSFMNKQTFLPCVMPTNAEVYFSFTVQSRQLAIIYTTQDLIVSRFATSSH